MGPRLLLAEDHVLMREALRALLEREGMTIVGEATDGREAVRLARTTAVDIAVLDVSMPILNGIDATREIGRVSPSTRVIVLTRHDEDPYVAEALRAGAKGYVLKKQAATDLLAAIREVSRGRVYLSPGVAASIAAKFSSPNDAPADPLSARERQVLQLIAEGRSSRAIAKVLGISIKTAESHRARLMRKLDIHETASLVRYAIRRGLIQP
jgi:two-component system response regulator NreC